LLDKREKTRDIMTSEKIDEIIEESKQHTGIYCLDFKNASPEDIDSFIYETLKVAIQKTMKELLIDIENLDFVKIWIKSDVNTAFKKQWEELKSKYLSKEKKEGI